MPAAVAVEEEADGSATVWLSEHDPMARMKGMHGVRLQPGVARVELRARVYNRTDDVQTFLWWANAGLEAHEQYQSFFPPDVVYMADHAKRAMSAFPLCGGSYYGVDYAARARDGGLLAPQLADPRFGGVFQFIQQFQGYICPGVVAAFVFGLLVPTAPPAAGVVALVAGPALYGLFQQFAPNVHFLLQVALTFQLVVFAMGFITFVRPLKTPRVLPVCEDLEVRSTPGLKLAGGVVVPQPC